MDLINQLLSIIFQNFINQTDSTIFSIILLTFAIKALTLPLYVISQKQQKRLSKIQPQLQKLLKQYKNDFQTYLIEAKKLKQMHNYNDWMLWAPMVLQAPLFITIFNFFESYKGFSSIRFLWIESLSSPDPLMILPLAASLLTYLCIKVSPKKDSKRIMSFIPPAISFIFLSQISSGIAIYYLTSNAFQLISQTLINKWI